MCTLHTLASIALIALTSACTSTLTIHESDVVRADKIAGRPAPASAQISVQTAAPEHTMSEATVNVAADVALRGIVMRRPDAQATVLYFGGNGFHLDLRGTELLKQLAACPVNVVSFDYRGYGHSGGNPTMANLAEDAVKLFDQANAWFPGQVAVHGQSLGSFMAAHVAGQRSVRGVVLEGTATNAGEWADTRLPWYVRPFVTLEIAAPLLEVDNRKSLANYTGPLLVVAGSEDKVTPQHLGRSIFESSRSSRKELVLVEQAGHQNTLSFPQGIAAYCRFLKRI